MKMERWQMPSWLPAVRGLGLIGSLFTCQRLYALMRNRFTPAG